MLLLASLSAFVFGQPSGRRGSFLLWALMGARVLLAISAGLYVPKCHGDGGHARSLLTAWSSARDRQRRHYGRRSARRPRRCICLAHIWDGDSLSLVLPSAHQSSPYLFSRSDCRTTYRAAQPRASSNVLPSSKLPYALSVLLTTTIWATGAYTGLHICVAFSGVRAPASRRSTRAS